LKDLVFMFKNQKNSDIDILKTLIKQWKKLYKDAGEVKICGSYNNIEISFLKEKLKKEIEKYNIEIINFKIPEYHKAIKLNIQMIEMWKILKKEYVFCSNDIFPIKLINDEHLNKEHLIRYKDYTKIDPKGWWEISHFKTLKYFNEKYNTDNKIVYNGHSFYTIDEEFMKFFLSDENFITMDRNFVKTQFLLMNGDDVYMPDLIGTTFKNNKLVWDKKKEKIYRGINVSLPYHPSSKKILKKFTK